MIHETHLYTKDDNDLAQVFISLGRLERAPGDDDNWIERAGSLPKYIEKIAFALHTKQGYSISRAIATAISRVKVWAAGGGGVKADTQAKAAKAVAQWTALKAKNKAKKIVKASHEDGAEYLMLANVSDYSLDQVRTAWSVQQKSLREQIAEVATQWEADKLVPYSYITEVYLNHVIASVDNIEPVNPGDDYTRYVRIPYSVENGEIVFGQPSPVELLWVDEENDWKVKARN